MDHLSLTFLVASQLEMLGALDGNLLTPLALSALETQHQLLGRLGLLPQDGLGLTSETLLLTIVTSTTLSEFGFLRLFVLRHLELFMLVATGAISLPGFRNIHLKINKEIRQNNVSQHGI